MKPQLPAMTLGIALILIAGCAQPAREQAPGQSVVGEAEPSAQKGEATKADSARASNNPPQAGAAAPECRGSSSTSPGDACAPPANGPGSNAEATIAPPPHASRSEETPSSSQSAPPPQ